jgi:hypothetical protein
VTGEFDPVRVLETLHRHAVEFVLVGGLAATAHGSTVVTTDVDITPERSIENLRRLASALAELNARLRVDDPPEGVAFPIEGEFLRAQPHMLDLVTDAGDLDLTFTPAGFPGGYADVRRSALAVHLVDQADTIVASLDDVIASKRAANRLKDKAALPYLEALRDEIRALGRPS